MMLEQTGTLNEVRNSAFAQSHFNYDALSRLTASWRDEQAGKGEWFGYDATGQLNGVSYNADGVAGGTPQNATRTVSYTMTPDTLNRASMNDNGDVSEYAPNALNQYESVAGDGLYYDGNFNLMWTGGFSAGYDSANHLTAISSGEDYGQFTYDGLGRCVKRTIDWETTLIAYDGWNPIVEWDEWDNLSAWNVYGAGADEILWRYSDRSGHLRYHSDRHGNIVALLDANGNGVEKYSYDAFGEPTVTDWSGGSQRDASWYWNRFLFRGREYFAGLGLYDYRNRFYHPILGRFLQSDPIGFGGGDANLFRYCGGDPINRSDPFGLQDAVSSRIIVTGGPLPVTPGRGSGPADPNNYVDFYGGGDVSAGPDEIGSGYPERASIAIVPPSLLLRPDDEEEPEAAAAEDSQSVNAKYDISGAINDLEKAIPRYTASFPQAPPAAPVVEALKQANAGGRIQIGSIGGWLPGEGMHTAGRIISINPRGDFRKFGFAPLLAHEGEHLADATPRTNQFQRERNAYDVQYYFSTIIGPAQAPYSNEEIRRDLDRLSHRRRY